jgi:multidrug efflux system outer membrane protein
MNKLRIAAASILAMSLGACSMAPDYARPGLPVPPAIPSAAQDAPSASVIPADLAWKDFFTDDRLHTVIQAALDNNRDLRIALANVEQARALYRVQRADLLPTIGAGGSATYQDMPAGTAMFGGRVDIYSANIGTSAWEIDLFGRIRDMNKAALEQYFATVEARNAAQTSLIAETASAWLTLAADRDRLRIAQETVKAFGQTLELTKARFAGGVASELEVRQAQTSYDQARSDIAQNTSLIAQDHNALELLAGTSLGEELLPAGLGTQGATIANLPEGLSSQLLLRRPDIASAEHQLRAANANIGAARAAFFPRISLTAAFGTMSAGLSNLFGNGSDYWSVAPSASLPIFDYGRNQGNLRYAKATHDAMVSQYERSIQRAFREAADALARKDTINAQVEAQTSLHDAAARAYQLAQARYRAGTDPFLATLDSQRALYAAEQSLLATRLAREANSVELYRAFGGGLK